MKRNLIIGITGSIAARLSEKIYQEFSQHFNVKFVATNSALDFAAMGIPFFDNDEVKYYKETGRVLHIDARNWASALVIAPLSMNTLAKAANGLCDNLLTNIIRAWDTKKPMILAPAANTAMWKNIITNEQIGRIRHYYGASVIPPVSKTLVCGETGIGAMADIGDIFSTTKKALLWNWPFGWGKKEMRIPVNNHPGAFGYKRSYYYHTGVDLYTHDFAPVYAMESGIITHIGEFTGASLGHKHWEDTKYIAIKGASGTIIYGEISPYSGRRIGEVIDAPSYLGDVKRVIPLGKERPDINGHSTSMLHLELYSSLPADKEPVSWHHNDKRDAALLDPTDFLMEIKGAEPLNN